MPSPPKLLQRLLGLVRRTPRAPAAAAPMAPAEPGPAPAGDRPWQPPDVQAGRAPYLAWLLALGDGPAITDAVVPARVLAALDAALATQESCARLLRRAPNVVPRLINTLRSDVYSRAEVAEQIERDAVLMAEVLRAARSVLYGHFHRGTPSVAQAVGLLGSAGLRQVIAKVLLRPLFAADGGGLQARAAARIWDESERGAALAVALAREGPVDAVDAYLAGLLHALGWSAMLHALQRHGLAPLVHRGLLDVPGLVAALDERRERVLALLLPAWEISPALTAMAHALQGRGEPTPLQGVLAQMQQLLVLRRMQIEGTVPGGLAPPPGCPAWVAGVYRH